MKTNYLLAVVTAADCGRFATEFFPAQGFLLLKGILVAADWQCAISLVISRALAGAGLLLGSGLWDDRIPLFVLTHAAGWVVKFLLVVAGSVA
jgi:hypothetical protein